MSTSIFLAELLGPIYVVVGIACLFKAETFGPILREFIGSRAWLYFAGVLGLAVGLAIVLTHNVWVFDWRVIITLIGWLSLVRGIISIFQSQWVVAAAHYVLDHRSVFLVAGAVNLLLGLILSFFGYYR